MAMPRSVMVCLAGLFQVLTNTPRNSSVGTFNHEGMPLGHSSSLETFLVVRYFSLLSLSPLHYLVLLLLLCAPSFPALVHRATCFIP